MKQEINRDDEDVIDTDDTYTDGDGIMWSIASVNVNARTVTLEGRNPPCRTIPLADLERMKCHAIGETADQGADVVFAGIGRSYVDGDDLYWKVKAVNLRDRTATLKLLNPPMRTLPVSELRSMRSGNSEADEMDRKLRELSESRKRT